MKSRAPLLYAAFAALVLLAIYLAQSSRPVAPAEPAAPGIRPLPASRSSPRAQVSRPPPPVVEIAIQDGKTIDFSQGSAEIRNTLADQAAMEAALKEIQEATKNITFEVPARPVP